MIRRLLLRHISMSQIAAYVAATLAGLIIVVCAVKFYSDIAPTLAPGGDENTLFSDTYLVVSKPVSILNTFGRPSSFTDAEIQDISSQDWADGVAPFVAANFSVVASVDFAGRGFSTHMFLEAIPDEFIDVRPEGWDYDPESDQCVPIIIPKDYLSLYNFGFAAARGLPQITPGMLSQVPVNLTLSGNGRNIGVCARIAGFSSRLNTIAVPLSFITAANALLAPGTATAPSRLIIRCADPANPAIHSYLESRGYETSGSDTSASRVATMLRVAVGIVIAVGAVIAALALIIILLSMNLLLQKNRTTISTLFLLGYTPGRIAGQYTFIIVGINTLITLLAVGVMFVASAWWQQQLAPLGILPGAVRPSVATAAGIMILLTIINLLTLRRRIKKMF